MCADTIYVRQIVQRCAEITGSFVQRSGNLCTSLHYLSDKSSMFTYFRYKVENPNKIFFDRIQKASTTFPSSPGGDRSHLKGWTVVGNGIRNPAWLDPDGLYSVDQMFNGVGAAFSKMTDSVIHATTTTTTTN